MWLVYWVLSARCSLLYCKLILLHRLLQPVRVRPAPPTERIGKLPRGEPTRIFNMLLIHTFHQLSLITTKSNHKYTSSAGLVGVPNLLALPQASEAGNLFSFGWEPFRIFIMLLIHTFHQLLLITTKYYNKYTSKVLDGIHFGCWWLMICTFLS